MSHAIEVIQKPDYLHIRVTGENTPEVAAAYLRDMLAVCIDHGCGVVLVEERSEERRVGKECISTWWP